VTHDMRDDDSPWKRQVETLKAQGRYQEVLFLVETILEPIDGPTANGEGYNPSLYGRTQPNLLPAPADTGIDALHLWFEKTLALQQLKRDEEALLACDHVIQLAPEMDSTWRLLGDIYHDMQRYDEAIAAYQHAITLDPDDAGTWNQLGIAYFDSGAYPKAEAAYDRALRIDPDDSAILNNKGRELNRQGRYQDALHVLQNATQLSPQNAAAWNNLGNALSGLEQSEDAIAAYRQAIALHPDFAMAWGNLAGALHDAGQREAALAAAEKTLQYDPQHAKAHLILARLLLDQKRFREAESAYRAEISRAPDLMDAWVNLGVALAGQGKLAQALVVYDTALALPTTASMIELANYTLFERGQALVRLKRFREAHDLFLALTETSPDDPRAWANLGTTYLCLHRFGEALIAYDEALARGEHELAALVWAGKGDAQRGLHHDAAAHEAYERALNLDPALDDAWAGLFYLYRAQWRFGAAAHALQQVVKLRLDAQNHLPSA